MTDAIGSDDPRVRVWTDHRVARSATRATLAPAVVPSAVLNGRRLPALLRSVARSGFRRRSVVHPVLPSTSGYRLVDVRFVLRLTGDTMLPRPVAIHAKNRHPIGLSVGVPILVSTESIGGNATTETSRLHLAVVIVDVLGPVVAVSSHAHPAESDVSLVRLVGRSADHPLLVLLGEIVHAFAVIVLAGIVAVRDRSIDWSVPVGTSSAVQTDDRNFSDYRLIMDGIRSMAGTVLRRSVGSKE